MTKKSKRKNKYIFVGVVLFFVITIAVVALLLVQAYLAEQKKYENDQARIAIEEYDIAFVSMFPVDNFSEEDFYDYFTQKALITSYCIPDESTLEFYLNGILSSENTVSTVYVGIRPEKISTDTLPAFFRNYPSVEFKVLLPYPSIEYWNRLSETQLSETLQSYRALTDLLLLQNNVRIYSYAKEWLICNSTNYDDTFLLNESVSHSLFLTWTLNEDLENIVTADNAEVFFSEFSDLIEECRTSPAAYPDLSKYKIVFFGDSIFGSFTDSSSIPGVVKAMTKAKVYNCGYGGNSAALYKTSFALADIANAFIQKEASLLPENTQLRAGVTEYLEDTSKAKNLCIIINYGLNDYFLGAPVTSDDPYDVTSYSGALRTTIESLQEAYPEAQIILTTPNFTFLYDNGEAINSEVGGSLCDYANAVLTIGSEYNVTVLDNFTELGINADNHYLYLSDGVHPNGKTRYEMAQRIISVIK